MHLSHLFFADDVVFMGQWNSKNIDTIIYVLKCFQRASGLCINVSKSKLLGIAVNDDFVHQAANRIGCGILKVPFIYLGSRVGGNMSRIRSWDEIVEKLIARLSKWKMNTLSIGGRLTLVKAVLGSIPIYHMLIFKVPMNVLHRMESIQSHFFNGVDLNSKKSIWVRWSKVLASKEKGGLGVSSFYALNRALMFKWVWRFKTQKEMLWSRVIKAIHGDNGRIGSCSKIGYKSVWCDLIREVEAVKLHGFDLYSCMQKKIGNGEDSCFWDDVWIGDTPLKIRYPRLYDLEVNKGIKVASKMAHVSRSSSFRRNPRSGAEQSQIESLLDLLEGAILGTSRDRWYWSLEGSGEFSVSSIKKALDNNRFPNVSSQTRWIKEVPIKVNVLAWKVRLDCLPIRLNLSHRGLDIPSILCPICGIAAESAAHVFFQCDMAKDLFRKVCHWWNVDFREICSYDDWAS
ncbi:RNA-directed DNA polymerase, eukaryota, reverse transcriptase zinc-binding domain protein [Tanacetum coccineum]|uniref:RNA-directed DNA polymerase, eukaryota, reverse transcriptase zinc-binding domain protein n=1 Tax=Tanacetum coccineum TaxID=301880 RepID=A0ABQ5CYF7_9ASTR